MKEKTLIQVTHSQWKRLNELRLPNETFSDVLSKLIGDDDDATNISQ